MQFKDAQGEPQKVVQILVEVTLLVRTKLNLESNVRDTPVDRMVAAKWNLEDGIFT